MASEIERYLAGETDAFNTGMASAKFDTQLDLASKVTGAATATVVDAGVSIWNSLAPLAGGEAVETRDLLDGISKDAAYMYDKNPEAIQTASLIAGSILPAGIALKGMQALRAGAKGASWFSQAGKTSNLKAIDDAVRAGIDGTAAERIATRAVLRNGVANNVLDAAATEAAMLMTMSAHPLLEDYFENPVENLGLSLVFGGVIGGGLGFIGDKAAVKAVKGSANAEINTQTYQNLYGAGKAFSPAAPNLAKLQALDSNVQVLTKLETEGTNEAVRQLAAFTKAEQQVLRNQLYDKASSGLPPMKNEEKDAILNTVLTNKEFATQQAADGISFYNPKDIELSNIGTTSVKPASVKDTATIVIDKDTGQAKSVTNSVFFPELNAFAPLEDAANFSRANSLGLTKMDVLKTKDTGFGALPRQDAQLTVATGSSPEVDKDFLVSLVQTAKTDIKALNVFAPDDLPALDALVSRAAKNPDEFAGKTFKITKAKPNFEQLESATLAVNPVKASHLEDIKKISNKQSPYYLGAPEAGLSPKAARAMEAWVKDTPNAKSKLRAGAEAYFRRGVMSSEQQEYANYIREMVENPRTIALKKHLKENVADSEGYVYLYRGQAKGRQGHSSIESYTPSKRVAEAFNADNARLFKVNVDDIVGYIDGLDELEYLVGSPKHPVVANLPISTEKAGGFSNLGGKLTQTADMSITQLKEMALAQKENYINKMKGSKAPEYIAIHTNTPLATVQEYLTNAERKSLAELEQLGFKTRFYDDADALDSYLDITKRPLLVKHNVNKLDYAAIQSNIDTKNVDDVNIEFIANTLDMSKSTLMKSIREGFLGSEVDEQGLRPMLDILRAQVGDFTNNKLGNPFVQSADFFLRDTAAGRIVTHIGKTINNIAVKENQRLVEPIAQKMSIVSNDVAKLTSFNILDNLMSSIKGWREVIVENGVGRLVQRVVEDGKTVIKPVQFQGNDFIIRDKDVLSLVDSMRSAGREMYEAKNTANSLIGRSKINDLGLWFPSIDFRNKNLAYVWNKNTQRTKVLYGNSEQQLKENIEAYRKSGGLADGDEIVTKQQQETYNYLNGRADPLTMEIANVEAKKQGSSANAVVEVNTNRMVEISGAYENLVESYTKQTASYMMSSTLDLLDNMSKYNQLYSKNQPLNRITSFLNKGEDGAAKVRNMLLGNSNLSQYVPWRNYNENFEIIVNYGANTIKDILGTMPSIKPFGKKSKKLEAGDLANMDYKQFSDRLEAAGVPNPYAKFDEAAAAMFGKTKLEDTGQFASRMVYAGNALAATSALRFLDIASPLVNMVSLPILTTFAKAQNLPPKLFNAMKAKSPDTNIASVMHDGIRLSNSPKGEGLAAMWEKAGHFTSFVTESNKALRLTRTLKKDLATGIEAAIDSKIVEYASWTADKTEDLLRRKTMFTGYVLAKRLYPDLSDTGATIFARDFMDRSMGNYHSGQRPVMFQGTLGVAMGLFQTYMLTMAQSMYRSLEMKDYKTIGKAMLAQSTIFGAGSLPGFDIISQKIGDNFSDDNIDLTTGTYRALPDKLAQGVIYGLPSSMGPALYTRGDINPRFPSPTDATALVGVNMIGQSVKFVGDLGAALANSGGNVPNALAQALSLQSVSRPLARVSEIYTGYSVSRAGDVFATPDEVRTFTGVASRVMGARPVQEQKARDWLYLDKTYGTIDRDARKTVTNELKLAIRNGKLDQERLEQLGAEYMERNGTPTGWRQAVNNAIAMNGMSGNDAVMEKLSPDSPFMHMMENLDGE